MSRTPARALVACAIAALLAACDGSAGGYDHAHEHPEGHDHHAQGHGHDEPMRSITLFSERFELFAEHPPAVVGQEVQILAHLTVLDGFRPLDQGTVRLELNGPAEVRAASERPLRPGIYQLSFTPRAAGTFRGSIQIEGAVSGSIDGLELEVYADAKRATSSVSDASEDAAGQIALLKEQQWSLPFATAFAERDAITASIEVAGTVGTPPGGSAEVGASAAGRIAAPPKGLPRPGDAVREGQLLALLAPAPSSPEGAARANLAVAEAEARRAAARAALLRSERLFQDQAISTRELEDARRELQVAEQAMIAARKAAELFSGVARGQGAGSWRLLAPIDGTLVSVDATAGATVAAGDVLFRIVDTRELWIRARVPEQDAARMRADRDARYRVTGTDRWQDIGLGGGADKSRLVTVGRTVDPVARTVDVIYALRDPHPSLRVGGLVQVSIAIDEDFSGVVVPRSAVIHREGREAVYVQLDGEQFAERLVQTGPRSGDRVGIVQGLAPGERIVTRGAHLVRLADRPQGTEPHGHIH